jgi:hypothetical protein
MGTQRNKKIKEPLKEKNINGLKKKALAPCYVSPQSGPDKPARALA